MIRYATNSQTNAAAPAMASIIKATQTVAVKPPVDDIVDVIAVVNDVLPAAALTRPAAEPLELTGEPAPKSKKATATRRRKENVAKGGKADGVEGALGVLSLDLEP